MLQILFRKEILIVIALSFSANSTTENNSFPISEYRENRYQFGEESENDTTPKKIIPSLGTNFLPHPPTPQITREIEERLARFNSTEQNTDKTLSCMANNFAEYYLDVTKTPPSYIAMQIGMLQTTLDEEKESIIASEQKSVFCAVLTPKKHRSQLPFSNKVKTTTTE